MNNKQAVSIYRRYLSKLELIMFSFVYTEICIQKYVFKIERNVL